MPSMRVASPLGYLCACVIAVASAAAPAQDDASSNPSDASSAPDSSAQPAQGSRDPLAVFNTGQQAQSDTSSGQQQQGTTTDPSQPTDQSQPTGAPGDQGQAAPAPDASAPAGDASTGQPAAAPAVSTIPVTPAPVATGSGATQLEEITVTAQKRVESLQSAPVSISAFNAQKLEARGIDSIKDMGSQVPGMQIEQFPIDAANMRIFIRGIGALDTQVTQDPAIGVYLDGVYLGRSQGLAFDVADLERIEVLRGPQGTLYGRNTTGGAVNLITKKPSTAGFEMTHKFIVGDRNHAAGRSMVNVPITDSLAAKVVVLSSQMNGFIKNSSPGGDFGDRQDVSTRADVRYEPLDWLTADYAFDYSDITYYQYMYTAILPPNTNHGQAEQFKGYAETQTLYSPKPPDSMASGAPLEPSTVRIRGHAFTLTGDVTNNMQVKYIGAFRQLRDKAFPDLSGGLDVTNGQGNPQYRLDSGAYDGPATQPQNTAITTLSGKPIPIAWLRTFQDQTSHEINLTGDVWNQKLHYITGVFYYKETGFDDRCGSAGDTCVDPETHQFHTLLNGSVSERLTNIVKNYSTDINNTSDAAFLQGTYTPDWLEQKLHVTLGYRHTVDKRAALKNYDSRIYQEDLTTGQVSDITAAASTCQGPNSTGQPGSDVFNNVAVARKFSNNSYAAILAYDLKPNINTYAKYVQAYKSGGFDTRDPQKTGETQASDCTTYHIGFETGYGPEYVDSYETGFKSEWLDRSVRINLNLFYMDYHDRQISALIQGAIQDTKTRNVGHSVIGGTELEAMWAARPGLVLSLEHEYLDARTLEVLDFNGNNVKDNYQPYSAPHNSYVVAADWTIMNESWGALHSYLNYNYVGHRNGQTLPNRVGLTELDAFGLLNFRLGVEGTPFWKQGRIDTALWVRNALNETYCTTALDNLPQADRAVTWGEPRTFGADFIYHWQ